MKIKKIIPSVMTTLMSIGLISGATYSLFTSESTHDITVTSGEVKVSSTLTNLKVYSMDELQAGTDFVNGGKATLNEGKTLELINVTPGDKITLDVVINNLSNVNIKYRVRCFLKSGSEGLFSKLIITSPATDWTTLLPGTEEKPSSVTKNVSIELDREATEFQDETLEIGIVVEAIQGNASNDIAYVTSLNKALAEKEELQGKNVKVGDVLNDLKTEGVAVENLTLEDTGNEIVWDQASDRFAILNNDTVTYPTTFGEVTKSDLWKFVNNATYEDNSLYSQYLKDDVYTKLDLTLQAGLDVGNNDEKFTFNLNTAEANKYTVTSNHKESKLTIDSANASVSHYGLLGESDIKNVAMHSYHEFGTTRLVSVVKGKVNVEPEAVVSVLAAKPVAEEDIVINKEETAIIKTAVKTNDVAIETNEKLEVVTPEVVEKKVTSVVNQEAAAEEGFDLLIEEEGKSDVKTSLAEFRNEVNLQHGTYNKSTVNVVRDIDLGGVEWEPIGGWDHCYNGVFNGNFYTISNFKPVAPKRAGLFGRTGLDGVLGVPSKKPVDTVYDTKNHTLVENKDSSFGAIIKNLTLDNVDSQQTQGMTGMHANIDAYSVLVGRAYNTKISNIKINNSSVQGNCKVGAIAGVAWGSTIENCKINNTHVKANYCDSSAHAGGIVGTSFSAVIDNCEVSKDSSVYAKQTFAAGILGYGADSGAGDYAIITNSVNNGTVYSETAGLGGIFGGNNCQYYLANVVSNGDIKLTNAVDPKTEIGGLYKYCDGHLELYNIKVNANIYSNIAVKASYIGTLGDSQAANVAVNAKYYVNGVLTETINNHKRD